MEEKIISLASSLEAVRRTFISPEEIPVDSLSLILEQAREVKSWINSLEKEAIGRILSGTECHGFEVHTRQYRVISDMEGAIKSLEAFNPDLVKQCTVRSLKNINALHKVLSRADFDRVIAPFTETRTSQSLVKSENPNIFNKEQ